MLTTIPRSNSCSTNVKINLKKAHNLPKLTKVQKTFGCYKPIKNGNRFLKDKIANTGEDPTQTFANFANKDLIHILKRDPLLIEPRYLPTNPLKWSMGCTKKCNSPLLLPKKQQFINYSYSSSSNPNYANHFISTDPVNRLSIKAFQINNNEANGQIPFLVMKSKYGSHSQSKLGWSAREDIHSVSNKSSVPFNIINWEKTPQIILRNASSNMFNKTLNNKKKGVAEFSDYTRLYNPNYNKEYRSLITENPKIFHQYNGIFSNLYDSAHKNGNIYIPFRRNASDIKLTKSQGNNLNSNDI